MAAFKVVIADPATGKCEQREADEAASKALLGLKIGDTVKGEAFSLVGKTLVVTGGSDYCGFPMRSDLPGTLRKRILLTKSIGFKGGERGLRRRRTVAGGTIHPKIHQINLKIQVEKPKKTKAERKAAKVEGAQSAAKAEKPKKAAKAAKSAKPAEE